ncbi:unnamed protein product [Caenorhabditis sp. 36 PRJEB53466]|nr:unnamed protein product [Caenorhabditis sp. 36 PRJEB53466]
MKEKENRTLGLVKPTGEFKNRVLKVHSAVLLLLSCKLLEKSRMIRHSYSDYSVSSNYCYSCMSEDFLLHWQYLDEVYYRPMNFTDYCFNIPNKAQIGTMPCSHSMCVTVIEPRILAGQHIGNNIIRGCFSGLFKYGSSPKTVNQQVLDTSCTRMPAHKLLPPRLAARSSNRTIEMCWCAGQLCNDYPSVAMNNNFKKTLHVVVSIGAVIFASFYK